MKFLLKILISVSLFAVILYNANFGQITQVFQELSYLVILSLTVLYAVGQLISSYKWQLILKALLVRVGFKKVVNAYFAGMGAGLLPFIGLIGSDLVRALSVSSAETRKVCLISVVFDRAHGLYVLLLIGLLANLIYPSQIPVLLNTLVILIMTLGVIVPVSSKDLTTALVRGSPDRLKPYLTSVKGIFRIKVFSEVTLISLVFHLFQITLQYYLAVSLGLDLTFLHVLAVVPLVNILTSLPISWQGLGIRESAYFVLFAGAISKEQAVVYGLSWLFVVTINGLLGALVFSGQIAALKESRLKTSNKL